MKAQAKGLALPPQRIKSIVTAAKRSKGHKPHHVAPPAGGRQQESEEAGFEGCAEGSRTRRKFGHATRAGRQTGGPLQGDFLNWEERKSAQFGNAQARRQVYIRQGDPNDERNPEKCINSQIGIGFGE
jgi:hypothetical protein